MSTHALEEILHPRAIAVVGASDNSRQGPGFINGLQELGYKGQIYPVNPKYTEVMGMKAYPTVKDIPGPVDYVISSIPASQVLVRPGVRKLPNLNRQYSKWQEKPEFVSLDQTVWVSTILMRGFLLWAVCPRNLGR